jgi:hypothetical protein
VNQIYHLIRGDIPESFPSVEEVREVSSFRCFGNKGTVRVESASFFDFAIERELWQVVGGK